MVSFSPFKEALVRGASADVMLSSDVFQKVATQRDAEVSDEALPAQIESLEQVSDDREWQLLSSNMEPEGKQKGNILPEHIETVLKTTDCFHRNGRINFATLARAANVNEKNLRYVFLQKKEFYISSPYLLEKHKFEIRQIVQIRREDYNTLDAKVIENFLKTKEYDYPDGTIRYTKLAKAAKVNKANLRRALLKSVKFYTSSPYLQERHDFEVQYLQTKALE
jgi:hypothetical protein